MRRALAILAAAAVLSAPSYAVAAPPPEPGVVADEEAVASWMFPTDRPRHSKWFFAGAYRNVTVGGRTVTMGFAVKGACEVVRSGGETVTRCHGRGIGGRLPERAFRVDVALREARLVLKEDGITHRLGWAADTAPPSAYVAGEACDQGRGQGAGSMRHAAARGELFDRQLGGAGIDHAFLARGAMLTECTGRSVEDLVRRAAAGKTLTIVFR